MSACSQLRASWLTGALWFGNEHRNRVAQQEVHRGGIGGAGRGVRQFVDDQPVTLLLCTVARLHDDNAHQLLLAGASDVIAGLVTTSWCSPEHLYRFFASIRTPESAHGWPLSHC